MILSEVKQYLQTKKASSLLELSLHFEVTAEFMRDMLQHWVRKGCIRCGSKTLRCGTSCQLCHHLQTEWYEWVI